jgi:hypothetical protein
VESGIAATGEGLSFLYDQRTDTVSSEFWQLRNIWWRIVSLPYRLAVLSDARKQMGERLQRGMLQGKRLAMNHLHLLKSLNVTKSVGLLYEPLLKPDYRLKRIIKS